MKILKKLLKRAKNYQRQNSMKEKFIVRKFYKNKDFYEDMEFDDLLEAARFASNIPKNGLSFDEIEVFNSLTNKLVFVPKRK